MGPGQQALNNLIEMFQFFRMTDKCDDCLTFLIQWHTLSMELQDLKAKLRRLRRKNRKLKKKIEAAKNCMDSQEAVILTLSNTV